MLTFLPAIVAALASSQSPSLEMVSRAPHTHTQDAGGRLAATLADASAIDWVAANDSTITFGIERGGAALRVTVTVGERGAIGQLSVVPVDDGMPRGNAAHVLSWLGGELRDAPAVAKLAVDADGVIVVRTSDGRLYHALPARIAGGNAAVEARWADAWDGGSQDGDSPVDHSPDA